MHSRARHPRSNRPLAMQQIPNRCVAICRRPAHPNRASVSPHQGARRMASQETRSAGMQQREGKRHQILHHRPLSELVDFNRLECDTLALAARRQSREMRASPNQNRERSSGLAHSSFRHAIRLVLAIEACMDGDLASPLQRSRKHLASRLRPRIPRRLHAGKNC